MADALFLAISVLTIGSAIAALEMRSLVYGSIALMKKELIWLKKRVQEF